MREGGFNASTIIPYRIQMCLEPRKFLQLADLRQLVAPGHVKVGVKYDMA